MKRMPNPFEKTITGDLARMKAREEIHTKSDREKFEYLRMQAEQTERTHELAADYPARVSLEELKSAIDFYTHSDVRQDGRAVDLIGAMLDEGSPSAEKTKFLQRALREITLNNAHTVHETIARPSLPALMQENVLAQFLADAIEEGWFGSAKKAMDEFGWDADRQRAAVEVWMPHIRADERVIFADSFELDMEQRDRLLAM